MHFELSKSFKPSMHSELSKSKRSMHFELSFKLSKDFELSMCFEPPLHFESSKPFELPPIEVFNSATEESLSP